ncbi:riboflavin synthase [Anaerosphaera multitolerans]|uniref:Riboflavin synthase n=1 Tax=Anaerosphaera multitolerans TaxID=2487351 RepID=A0A437S5T4_9FIRM|nr:riboflavin synthase [Anaerosphaera multitolerans]RVU54348.1 riboflavin synthase [Anaerosphaera multitolerans]
MFTGLIEEVGKLQEVVKNGKGYRIKVQCNKVLEDIKIGASISTNGICLTVVEYGDNYYKADIMDVTAKLTGIHSITPGSLINLERALLPTDRLGGHILQGHVDCGGRVERITYGDNLFLLEISVPSEYVKYIVSKGSIGVNGISLTVAEISGNIFTLSIIPETLRETNLKELKEGDIVTVECDIIGKYVEKLMVQADDTKEKGITEEFLKKYDF